MSSPKSQTICIPEGELNLNGKIWSRIKDDFTREQLTEVVLLHFNPEDLKVGDVIHFDDYSDHIYNEGKVLWGPDHSVAHLTYDQDDDGYPPSCLPINLFPSVDHFGESINRNNYVWFDRKGYHPVGSLKNKVSEDKIFQKPIYLITYKKIDPVVKGADFYYVYTFDPMTLISKKDQLFLLTWADDFGVKFMGPHSLFDNDSFKVADQEYAEYLNGK